MAKKMRNLIVSLGIALGIYSNIIGNSYSLINSKIFNNKKDLSLKNNQENHLIYNRYLKIQEKFDIEKYLANYNYENSYLSKKMIKDNKYLIKEGLFLNQILLKDYKKSEDYFNLNENIHLDYAIEDLKKDDEVILLARMILGEGEGCSKLEKIAIGYTVLNRANDNKEWNGTTIKEVLLKEYQYESLNDKSRLKVLKNPLSYNPKEFLESLEIAEGIINNRYVDPTNGATHFYNPRLMKKPPKWVGSNGFEYIGKKEKSWYHLFYKEK